MMFDITDRKLAEAALQESEARNRALLDAIPDMMFRLDGDGRYLDFKAERPADLALPPNVLIGTTIDEVLPPEVARQIHGCIERALGSGAAQQLEYQLRLEHGARDFEARFVICGEREVLTIVRDITERKTIDRMKNEFISTVSHELRTPLTSIIGSLALLSRGAGGELPEKVRAMLQIAYKNSERLVRLINDILDIEKIESGKMTLQLRPVELWPLVEQAVEANRAYGRQFGIVFDLSNRLQPGAARVNVDPDRLLQALTNLLSNAAKFSPIGGGVAVAVARPPAGEGAEGAIRIAIADQGPGIPESFRDSMFQKFAQADASDTRQRGGTGLGLSITKAIVEKLGGAISYETRIGRGTTFFLDLPEWRDTPPQDYSAFLI
jgi:PAS domain S-box-containing protein